MRLKRAKDLTRTDLPRIESPFYARSQIEHALSHPSGSGHIWELESILRSESLAFNRPFLRDAHATERVLEKLEHGELFLLTDKPVHPVVRRQPDGTALFQGHWAFANGLEEWARWYLEHLLTAASPPLGSGGGEASGVAASGGEPQKPGPKDGKEPKEQPADPKEPQAPPPAVTGLGADVDQFASKSPSLQKDLKQLQQDGWAIKYGPAGGGSFADIDSKTIEIDGAEKGKPAEVVQSLAHEVGHATYQPKNDFSSRDAFIRALLAEEGAATMNNIKVQREILANGGKDIGIAGDSANYASYNKAYDQFLRDGDRTKAQDAIGKIFGNGEKTSTTGQTYSDYYGDWYDKSFPNKK